jgi:uncharacterized Zn finger protein (UPF0148 family)
MIHHPKWADDQSLKVCHECFQNKPRCKACGMPFNLDGAQILCPTCAQFVPRCLSCGKLIVGRYVETHGKGPYCLECHQNRPSCDVCGAPIKQGEQRWQLSDGRVSCNSCHATAVHDPNEAKAIYDDVKNVIAQTLSITLNVPTGLSLVDQQQFMEVLRQQGAAAGHDPAHTLGVYARRGMRRGLYIQTGLPRMLLFQIAAHEYGHAWQGENCPLLRDALIREGFAEWIAYKTLQAKGKTKEMKLMAKRTDIYGQGLQWALAVEKRHGVEGVKESCRQAR